VLSIVIAMPFISFQWKSMQNSQGIEEDLLNYVGKEDILIVSGEDKFLDEFNYVIPINLFKNARTEIIDYDIVFSRIKSMLDKKKVYIYCDNLELDKIKEYLDKYYLSSLRVNTEKIRCLLEIENNYKEI
jgi:hypothetical protein